LGPCRGNEKRGEDRARNGLRVQNPLRERKRRPMKRASTPKKGKRLGRKNATKGCYNSLKRLKVRRNAGGGKPDL